MHLYTHAYHYDIFYLSNLHDPLLSYVIFPAAKPPSKPKHNQTSYAHHTYFT